ncbi:MAG TPA: hemerythrin domain-containing protein [Terriglobales bacterium]|nr:hemerythrin domain-containing protein [Terriglobales bacterium]
MANLKPTEVLEREHHFIQQVVASLLLLAEELEKGAPVPPETLTDTLEFLRTFADRCHHGKEETYLFPLLEQKGVPPQGCPLGVLKKEHDSGRSLVAQLVAVSGKYANDDSKRQSLRTTLLSLAELYGGHIWKENYLLFPMTNKLLSSEEQDQLAKQFEDVESSIGPDVQRRFEELAGKLQRRAFHD